MSFSVKKYGSFFKKTTSHDIDLMHSVGFAVRISHVGARA